MKLLIYLFLFVNIVRLQGQAPEDTSAFQYFVLLDLDIEDDTLEEYLDDLNSNIIWYHEPTGLAVWEVVSYPFTMANGTQIFDINAIIRESKKKTKVAESDFNVLSSLDDMNADTASLCYTPSDFSISQGSIRNIKMAILDTGIDPDIQLASDSIYNFNLTSYTGYDYINNDSNPDDENGHGSHIAGIIYSITNGVSSSSSQVTYNIKKTHNSLGKGRMSTIIKAFLDAVDEDMDIINLSFGLNDTLYIDGYFPFRTALQYSDSFDVMVVVSAGNSNIDIDDLNNTFIPAAIESGNIISIGSVGCNDTLSLFSNYGKYNVDLATLGEKITGPSLTGTKRYASGTSQSAAIVSGVAALLGTHLSEFDPISLKCALVNGTTKLASLDTSILSSGIINVDSSLLIYQNLTAIDTVSNADSIGYGSLKYILTKKCGVDTIYFDNVINGSSIHDVSKYYIDFPIAIYGNGIENTIIDSYNVPLFNLGRSSKLTLSNIRINNFGNTTIPLIYSKGSIIINNNVAIE